MNQPRRQTPWLASKNFEEMIRGVRCSGLRHLETSHIILRDSHGVVGILRLCARIFCSGYSAGIKRGSRGTGSVTGRHRLSLAGLVRLALRARTGCEYDHERHYQEQERKEHRNAPFGELVGLEHLNLLSLPINQSDGAVLERILPIGWILVKRHETWIINWIIIIVIRGILMSPYKLLRKDRAKSVSQRRDHYLMKKAQPYERNGCAAKGIRGRC